MAAPIIRMPLKTETILRVRNSVIIPVATAALRDVRKDGSRDARKAALRMAPVSSAAPVLSAVSSPA
jgi:hypothetical protein